MSKTIAVVIVVGLLLALPLAALRSANSFSREAWDGIGRSRRRWAVAFSALPFLVGPVAAIFYLARIRPGLVPFGRVPEITQACPATIVRGPAQGQVGVATPGKGLYRFVFGLTGFVWFTFDTGERGAVARELLAPR